MASGTLLRPRLISSGVAGSQDVLRLMDNMAEALAPTADRLSRATGWTKVSSFLNGWWPYSGSDAYAPQYMVDMDGCVRLYGVMASGTISTTLGAFRLPAALAPRSRTAIIPIATSGIAGELRILTDGSVCIAPPSSNVWASLDGVIFPVGL